MPQTYAHQHFGDLVHEQLPEEIRVLIHENIDLYNIGLQGPDILFYYHPLSKNPVATLGDDMHEWSGRRFFARSVKALTGMDPLAEDVAPGTALAQPDAGQTRLYTSLSSEEASGDDADAALAYLYGCLCHFALDSICHPYIIQFDEMEPGVTHSAIEGDLDRYLIDKAGRNPVLEDHTARFLPSKEAAHVIARFYPEVPEETLYAALQSFVRFHHLLRCPTDGKRNFLYTALRFLGKNSLRGHITSPNPDPLCKESSAHLAELLQSAVPCATGLIAGFSQNLRYDTQFRLNFLGAEAEHS